MRSHMIGPMSGENKESIVERRLRYIERQRKLGHGVNVQFEGLKPQGSGPPNRHGLPKVPIDQRVVSNWPVLDLGAQPDISLAEWRLEVTGLVENPLTLNWDQFMALPQVDDVSDFHCVTTWSRFDVAFAGVAFFTLAELVKPKASAKHVFFKSYDGYSTNNPIEACMDEDVLVAHSADGQPLTVEHGGPARLILPKRYAWKGAKFLREITFLDRDILGFWEVRGYSKSADPWLEERFSTYDSRKLP